VKEDTQGLEELGLEDVKERTEKLKVEFLKHGPFVRVYVSSGTASRTTILDCKSEQ